MSENTASEESTPAETAPATEPSEPLSPEETLNRLAARVEHLEVQNDGLKRVGGLALLLVLLLGGIVVHQAWSELSLVSTGGMVLHDQEHEIKACMTVQNSHVALVPTNGIGILPALRDNSKLGEFKGLCIYDSQGIARIIVGVNANDEPMVAVLDQEGHPLWTPATGMLAPAKPAPSPKPAK